MLWHFNREFIFVLSPQALSEVLVTSVLQGAAKASEAVGITYAFQAAKVRKQYWEQTDQGTKGGESVLAWDIKENREV